MPQVTAMPKIELPELMKILETEAFEKSNEPWAALTISPKRFLMALEQLSAALSELSELRKASIWKEISKDGLPADGQQVLVRVVDDNTSEGGDCNIYPDVWTYYANNPNWEAIVTHWKPVVMPLPASAVEENHV